MKKKYVQILALWHLMLNQHVCLNTATSNYVDIYTSIHVCMYIYENNYSKLIHRKINNDN